MTNNAKKTAAATPADVVAVVEEKTTKTVPTQAGPEVTETVETVGLTVIAGEKKTFAERVAAVKAAVQKNKKVITGVAVAAGLATLAFVKYTASQAVELEVVQDEDDNSMPVAEVTETEVTVEPAA